MDNPERGITAMRRGSYDDAAASLRPHLRNLAQRRRSAPSLVFGKALGIPWSPIREKTSCWVSVEQSPFVHGLTGENGELLLDERVQVTEGTKTRERHLFLFSDVIVFAKLKSTSSYHLKHRVSLRDIWLHSFEDEQEDEEGPVGDIDFRVTLILAWAVPFCLVCFRKIKEAKARAGIVSSPPDVLMKVLSGSVVTKTPMSGVMEQFTEFPFEVKIKAKGDANIPLQPKPLNNQDDKLVQSGETKWSQVRKLLKGQGAINKTRRSDINSPVQLFGQSLSKICPDDSTFPKPLMEMLVLLRKRGPSTEGVFRKPCNTKNMRDIREKLNSGMEVDMESLPVVLLVGLLKSFLKEIPGSLLISELNDKWMTALENNDSQQRVLEIRKIVDELPEANKLLLQYLLCILHHVLRSADVNRMDAYNLTVCIAPSLLELNGSGLDEQKEKMKKVTELTQFLIEHCEMLGDGIPHLLDTDEESLSSHHHDSAYDSTDPDGDGEGGEFTIPKRGNCGSSPSLSPSVTSSSWSSDAVFMTRPGFDRRCSEPIILPPKSQCSRARSHDDCSVKSRDFEEQPLKKQISDDSFLLKQQDIMRPVLSFPKRSGSSEGELAPYQVKDCSCSSLESNASNQSEGSVFASSPAGSPSCSRRMKPICQTAVHAGAQKNSPLTHSQEKKRLFSMRVPNMVLTRTRSFGGFVRGSLKKLPQKENSFTCETLQEDSQSEADPLVKNKARPLSAIEVLMQVDSRSPCRPPSYEEAVHNLSLPPQYRSMTVYDAIELEQRSRPSSENFDFPVSCMVAKYHDSLAQASWSKRDVIQHKNFRQRALSESEATGRHGVMSRRCSHPVYEEFSYAKESYV